MSDYIFHTVLEGVTYDLVKYIFGPLIVTAAFSVILRSVFGKLQKFREAITFAVACFIAVCTLFYFIGATRHGPILVGTIQQAQGGPANSGHDTVMIVVMSIINSGDMQTIVKDWKVEAVMSGMRYSGILEEMPGTFTFNAPENAGTSFPTSLTYKREDNILEKALTPIQPGAMLPGTLFVVFNNIDPPTLKAAGADITVSFDDINSNPYRASAKISAQTQLVGTVLGLHTDKICPVPPDLLNSLKK